MHTSLLVLATDTAITVNLVTVVLVLAVIALVIWIVRR